MVYRHKTLRQVAWYVAARDAYRVMDRAAHLGWWVPVPMTAKYGEPRYDEVRALLGQGWKPA